MTSSARTFAVSIALLGAACSRSPSPTLQSADPAPPPPAPTLVPDPALLALEVAPVDATFSFECTERRREREPRVCSPAAATRFLQGTPLSIVVRLRNTGRVPAEIALRPGGLDHDLEIVGPDGAARPLTRYGEKRRGDQAEAARTLRTLAPAGTIETRILVSRIVDITEPGIYHLTVVRRGVGGDTRAPVMTFDVTSY